MLFYPFPASNQRAPPKPRLLSLSLQPIATNAAFPFPASEQRGAMSPGAVTSPRKGGYAAVDSKAAGKGNGSDKSLNAPDLLKWVKEPTGQGLSERLHFIDLNHTTTRSTFGRDCERPFRIFAGLFTFLLFEERGSRSGGTYFLLGLNARDRLCSTMLE